MFDSRSVLLVAFSPFLLGCAPAPLAAPPEGSELDRAAYGWLEERGVAPLEARIAPPSGAQRVPVGEGSFAAWLRGLPLLDGRPELLLHDGAAKGNQSAHHAVVAIDVGRRDLQQCADAVMRLRAEYLWHAERRDEIAFDFTSGDRAAWPEWREGARPRVRGNDVSWQVRAEADASRASFRRYLDTVFTYAGSASLERELERVGDPVAIRAGDVFIQGGFPGHAVIVVDVAERGAGERFFLLAQSYMPAQQIHILRNPDSPLSPWYRARATGPLITPEWSFDYTDLHRFPAKPEGPDHE